MARLGSKPSQLEHVRVLHTGLDHGAAECVKCGGACWSRGRSCTSPWSPLQKCTGGVFLQVLGLLGIISSLIPITAFPERQAASVGVISLAMFFMPGINCPQNVSNQGEN